MQDKKQPKYWVFKHKPGKDSTEEQCKQFVLKAITLNCALMQFEYGREEDPSVTRNWNLVYNSNIKEGDYIFLRGGEYIYAVGRAIRPRIKADIVLSIKEIINKHDHGNYISGKYNGIIHFSDSEVFYENLSKDEEGNWGQRIDVDSWMYYNPKGIYAKSQDYYCEGQSEFGVIKELIPEKGKEIINSLMTVLGMKLQLTKLLQSNYNLILTGAPGTGKSYLATQIARLIMFGKAEQRELSDIEIREFQYRCKMVQFHPSYDYTDFVEGLRPVNKDGQLVFERKDGSFMEFCRRALDSYNNALEKTNAPKYVFIIDEINRGEMSKIFGELFFSIDPGYRGVKGRVLTQYNNLIEEGDVFKNGFYVPENVYIIGTMNDIDRSVESMDFAFRRRFAFKEIGAEERTIMLDEKIPEQAEKAKERMKNLNLAIETIEGLSKAYHIGPAYFLKLKNYLNDKKPWDSLWNNHLEGLLREYLRGMPEAVENLKSLAKAYGYESDSNNGQ